MKITLSPGDDLEVDFVGDDGLPADGIDSMEIHHSSEDHPDGVTVLADDEVVHCMAPESEEAEAGGSDASSS